MRILTATQIEDLGYTRAADALIRALAGGFDPAGDPARVSVPVESGAFLLMPSQVADSVGLKALTYAPGNPALGVEKIQGLYMLCDADTLTPHTLLDGAALTTLRTPALSLAAARPYLHDHVSTRPEVVIFGAGPQAVAHADALIEDRGNLARVSFLVRTPRRAHPRASTIGKVLTVGSSEACEVLARAHIVVCATGATQPLFEACHVRPDALVIALGSHVPEAREVPGELMRDAVVIVEDRGAALREAGDVVLAIGEGFLTENDLVTMGEIHATARKHPQPDGRPVVVKTVGMGWEDVVVARAVASHHASVPAS